MVKPIEKPKTSNVIILKKNPLEQIIMTDEPVKNKRITIGKVIFLLLIAIFVFIMFPRRNSVLDGGTVYYESWPLGIVYSVEKLHEFVHEKNNNYIRKGNRIRILNKIVYEDSYVDYDHPLSNGHSPEYYEASRQLESALGNTKSESEVPSNRVSSAIK